MANITILTAALAGSAPTVTTAGVSGDVILDPDQAKPLFIRATNAHASVERTITFDDPTSVSPASASAFNADVAVSVPALSTRLIRIVKPSRFADPTTGDITMTYSSNADLTLEVFQ